MSNTAKTVWITYAWSDNEDNTIDFIAQELIGAGLIVKRDSSNIVAGGRLWEEIDKNITNIDHSDAWLFIATQASLNSQWCKEEYGYAIDRALGSWGNEYPVIAIFPSSVDESLIPAGIRTRLCVRLSDADWKERIVSAVEGRQASIARPVIDPYERTIHFDQESQNTVFEFRPRAGVWSPVFAAIPIAEKDAVDLFVLVEPKGSITGGGLYTELHHGPSNDGNWWMKVIQAEATPTMSLYVWCKQIPSMLKFGQPNSKTTIYTSRQK